MLRDSDLAKTALTNLTVAFLCCLMAIPFALVGLGLTTAINEITHVGFENRRFDRAAVAAVFAGIAVDLVVAVLLTWGSSGLKLFLVHLATSTAATAVIQVLGIVAYTALIPRAARLLSLATLVCSNFIAYRLWLKFHTRKPPKRIKWSAETCLNGTVKVMESFATSTLALVPVVFVVIGLQLHDVIAVQVMLNVVSFFVEVSMRRKLDDFYEQDLLRDPNVDDSQRAIGLVFTVGMLSFLKIASIVNLSLRRDGRIWVLFAFLQALSERSVPRLFELVMREIRTKFKVSGAPQIDIDTLSTPVPISRTKSVLFVSPEKSSYRSSLNVPVHPDTDNNTLPKAPPTITPAAQLYCESRDLHAMASYLSTLVSAVCVILLHRCQQGSIPYSSWEEIAKVSGTLLAFELALEALLVVTETAWLGLPPSMWLKLKVEFYLAMQVQSWMLLCSAVAGANNLFGMVETG
ncbi:hypothetical protein HDU96_003935 [Phlyctochytrium bullatum]|nr:hypothetical protein HDU96_003935 [Phlyctochytrium bullatum]